MERGLAQLALSLPEVAFGRDQPIAHHQTQAVVGAALDVARVVLDQHVVDRVGVVQDDEAKRPELVADQVAELIAPVGEQPEPVGHDVEVRAEIGEPARSGQALDIRKI